jgi:hypothetical protein
MKILGFTLQRFFLWLPLFWLLHLATPTVELDGDQSSHLGNEIGLENNPKFSSINIASGTTTSLCQDPKAL